MLPMPCSVRKLLVSAMRFRFSMVAQWRYFVQIVRKYTDVQELSYEIVHEFIDRILVYELDKDTNTRKVEIYYSFVGQVDTGEAHTESVSFFRQIGADVKSYAV